MTNEEAKQIIVETVTSLQGCKATELVSDKRMVEVATLINTLELSALIDQLVEEGKLVEIEYELNQLHYRTKSFLLPGDVKIIGSKKFIRELTTEDLVES
jgi:Tfp pilus assembly ATPase PilU